MKHLVFSVVVLCLLMNAHLRAQSGSEVLKKVYKRYYQAPCKTFTFSQKNTHYRNDTVSGRSEWHEAIEYPDKFRIDFGDKATGNYVIFKNDSAFNYKKNQLVKARSDSSTLLLLLGGMFYRKLDDVERRLVKARYNLKLSSVQSWNGSPVYVIGAKIGDLTSNQVWIDKNTLRVLRIIETMESGDTMDMRFEAHQDWCKGYGETKVSFRRNGVLEQVEEYYNIQVADHFPDHDQH